jgi:uncharacterized protein YdaU (DUF1376 family)
MIDKPKLVYFPLPIAAWERIARDLNAQQHRALWRLVAHYATEGALPNDDERLATIVGLDVRTWRRMRPILQAKFPQPGWQWPEIDQKIMHWQKISVKRSVAGSIGNARRWQHAKPH